MKAHVLQRGLELLEQARQALEDARERVDREGPTEETEADARAVLAAFRSAMNWLEDSEHFETAHAELDGAGRFVCSTFGCSVTYEDGTYYQDCPVVLAHNRIGFSIGGTARRVTCSICGDDPDDCTHVTGRVYEGQMCVHQLAEVSVAEVSLVAKPAQPDARIMRMSIDHADLVEALGPEFEAGMIVNCHRCLLECDGVVRPLGGSHG